jgi:hypothetical protein
MSMKTTSVRESFARKRHVAALHIECIDWRPETSRGNAKIQELKEAKRSTDLRQRRDLKYRFDVYGRPLSKIRKWIILSPEPLPCKPMA